MSPYLDMPCRTLLDLRAQHEARIAEIDRLGLLHSADYRQAHYWIGEWANLNTRIGMIDAELRDRDPDGEEWVNPMPEDWFGEEP